MTAKEDYSSLVQGLSKLEFCEDRYPCQLLLTGDTAFPLLVTPAQHVLLAASRYGKGKIVVMSHEAYLDQPQFTAFLKNAISWLKPSAGAIIGINSTLSHLEQTLSSSGHNIEKVSGLKKDLGVFCTTGYDDSQAQDIVTFLREGGGVLIGAQAWYWSQCNKQENVLLNFPGNKITSVAGVYFTDKYGEKGNFYVGKDIPPSPVYTDVNFSVDLKHLMQGVSDLDINGTYWASDLLLHGPLTFPVGVTNNNQCFFGATYYGKGRVVVGTQENYIYKPELKTFILNIVSWLDMGRNGKIGVNRQLGDLLPVLQNKGLSCVASDLIPGLSVYCCTSYSDAEAEKIQRFVAEGGGLLIAGHAWYWSYSNPNVLSQYPGNKIINKFGISILAETVKAGTYKALDPTEGNNTYNFRQAMSQFLRVLKNEEELKLPLSSWLTKLRQDAVSFMRLPGSPLISSLQQELENTIKRFQLPNVSKLCPVKNCSKDAFIICFAHEMCCQKGLGDQVDGDIDLLDKNPVTVQIDATNPGGDAWRSTGLFLSPGKTAILKFPASASGKGLQVQVGHQADDLNNSEEFRRAPVVVNKKDVLGEKVKISTIWGGLIYIIVKAKSQLGMVPVSVYGAELSPTFIKGQTSLSSWMQTIRNYPAPWAELITENIILTVPSESIRSLEDPEALMSMWDKIMEAVADLAAIPKKFPRPERFVTDVQISYGWMHSGYPIMCHSESANALTSSMDIGGMKKTDLWGPAHELGHNQQKSAWEFPPHTTEATCNLWSVYVHETILDISRNQAHPDLAPLSRETKIKQYLENGAKLEQWSVWTALETYLQLQEAFGWDPFKRLFADYQTMSNVSDDNTDKMNLWAEKFSQTVNKNLVPFFKSWGWPIKEQTSQKLSSLPAWEEDPMKKYINSM